MIRTHRAGLIGCLVMLIGSAAFADVPRTIHYQGRLTDADGTPLVGEHAVIVRLYDAATEGTRLWEESHAVVMAREDRGLFSVVLGSLTSFPDTFLFNSPLWLTTEVDAQGELLPRQALSSVSSALNADRLDGLDSTEFLRALAGEGAILESRLPETVSRLGATIESGEVTNGTLIAADTAETFLTAGSGVLITKTPETWSIAAVGSGGDVTSVVAGTGLSGGATSGEATVALAVPVAVAHGGTGVTALPKGHLLVGTAAAPAALAPGSDGSLLRADASQPAGIKWVNGCWPIGGADATARSATFQLAAFGGSDTNGRAGRLWPSPVGGAVTGLRAVVGQAPGANGSWTVRLKKNNANTALSCSISGAATACTAAGQEMVIAGDRLGVELVQTGNAASTQGAGWSACLVAN